MAEENYMLVFRGQLMEGVTVTQATDSLSELFKVSQEKAEQLFTRSSAVLKRNITREVAERFQERLHKLGMVTVIEPMAAASINRAQPAIAEMQGGAAQAEAASAGSATGVSGDRQRILSFEFLGQGGEYFRIWIVNILLTILTLGIYSAWAKVRNHRYFYGNTRLDGHSFEYLANPLTLLKSRIVAVVLLALYMVGEQFAPEIGIALGALFVIALPWVVCRSMAFRNYNTRYRNIRFGFDGKYFGALKAVVLWPLVGAITLGLLLPYAVRQQMRFLVENTRYGTRYFTPEFSAKSFYAIYLAALGILLVGVVLMFIPLIGPLFLAVAYLFAFAYIAANSSNRIYNGSHLEQHGFDSRLRTGSLAFIYVTNGLLILMTLGLGIPWAKVRLARYRAESLSLKAHGSLDQFLAAEGKRVAALGEEIGEAFDVAVGL